MVYMSRHLGSHVTCVSLSIGAHTDGIAEHGRRVARNNNVMVAWTVEDSELGKW